MIKCQEVIITDLEVRGDGKGNPYRRILQVYDKEGNLIAENDHHELQRLVMEKSKLEEDCKEQAQLFADADSMSDRLVEIIMTARKQQTIKGIKKVLEEL